jgi:hypothetical protein
MREEWRRRDVWKWETVGATLGLYGGVVSALIGSVLTVFSWFKGAAGASVYLRATGTILLVLMIPLLIFGAHCLDLSEKRKKAEREGRFV